MKSFAMDGVEFEVRTEDEVEPRLLFSLVAECECRNNTNPNLIRINKNTWIKKKDKL